MPPYFTHSYSHSHVLWVYFGRSAHICCFFLFKQFLAVERVIWRVKWNAVHARMYTHASRTHKCNRNLFWTKTRLSCAVLCSTLFCLTLSNSILFFRSNALVLHVVRVGMCVRAHSTFYALNKPTIYRIMELTLAFASAHCTAYISFRR